jgi:hypothetical protein
MCNHNSTSLTAFCNIRSFCFGGVISRSSSSYFASCSCQCKTNPKELPLHFPGYIPLMIYSITYPQPTMQQYMMCHVSLTHYKYPAHHFLLHTCSPVISVYPSSGALPLWHTYKDLHFLENRFFFLSLWDISFIQNKVSTVHCCFF